MREKPLEKQGKAAMCIKMLQILNTGRIYKISELAEILGTNPRNVIEYKKEIDKVAKDPEYDSKFYLETIPGRYGGYRLNGNICIPTLSLTEEEKNLFVQSFNYLITNPSVIKKTELEVLYSKIMSNMLISNKHLEFVNSTKIQTSDRIREIKRWHNMLSIAIQKRTVMEMRYKFLKKPEHTVIIHPYQLVIVDNEWRLFAWSTEVNDIFYYKLSRITELRETKNKFVVWKGYKLENYLKDGVFLQNGEMFEIVLVAEAERAKLFSEKTYGQDQYVERLGDGRVRVTLKMQNNPSTFNFLLGCGDLIKIENPEWLKDKIKNLALSIFKKYESD